MLMRRDILIWLAIWSQTITNIRMREICSVPEVSNTALTERINQVAVVTWTAVHLLYVLTAVVNVWVATLSLVVKAYGTKKTKL